jgi:hypothetical protein
MARPKRTDHSQIHEPRQLEDSYYTKKHGGPWNYGYTDNESGAPYKDNIKMDKRRDMVHTGPLYGCIHNSPLVNDPSYPILEINAEIRRLC